MSASNVILAKFGSLEHMTRLLKYGEVYISPRNRFAKMDAGQRGDPDEGYSWIVTAEAQPTATITIPHTGEKLSFPLQRISRSAEHNDFGVYCTTGLEAGAYSPEAPKATLEQLDDGKAKIWCRKDMSEFGSWAVVFKDSNAFARRVNAAAKSRWIGMSLHPVEYVRSEAGVLNLGPFQKRDTYSHQAEWRFLFHKTIREPFMLRLGSIEDIAILVDVSGLWQ